MAGLTHRLGMGFVACLWALLIGFAGTPAVQAADAAPDAYTLNSFDPPFELNYAFLAWKDQIKSADGKVVLRNLPCNGGAGIFSKADYSAYGNSTPVLKIKTTAANTAKMIQLKFSDAEGRTGAFQYLLPPPSDDFVSVMPRGSSALSTPNVFENLKSPENPGTLDLANIVQYQLLGDWTKAKLDLEIDAVLFMAPDATMLADREATAKILAEEAAAKAKKDLEEKEKLVKERENKIRAYTHRTYNSPTVKHVAVVAPDVLSIVIEAQWVIQQSITPYVAQEGDVKKEETRPDGTVKFAKLTRNGKYIGKLFGKNLDWYVTDEQIQGDPLLEWTCDEVDNYTVQSSDDPAFAQPTKPTAVYRKSMPTNTRLPGGAHPARHRVYLKLPSKIESGKTYSITIDKVNVQNAQQTFKATLENVLSESVHVNQIGYRPDDGPKRAFLSLWMGTGGAQKFPEGLKFSVLEDATSKPVFEGNVEQVLDVDGTEAFWTKPPKNYNNTAVYRMDFTDVKTPGTYRVYVDGIGCSYPFSIDRNVWDKAFWTQMKGLYNQRSGVELGPPYTDFKRPRDFHPDDGVVATRSTYNAFVHGMHGVYKEIAKQDTGEPVKDAWGGYHDAGDWNPRRVTHMKVTMAQLELAEMFPQYYANFKLNIPPMEGVPDVINEALFEIDCFRRLQTADGGIPWGLETEGDPLSGEVSWLTTQKLYVLAPTIRDSWLYASVAGQAARVLRPIKPELASVYEQSAIRAYAWAEADYAKNGFGGAKETWDAVDARNHSALILYDLTGDQAYHKVFLETTLLKNPGADIYAWGGGIQNEAAFLYARMDDAKVDPTIKKNAHNAVIGLAERSLKYAAGNAFNVTNRERGRPMFAGFFTTAGGGDLVRAHFLTGKKEYLDGAVVSCQFQSGANPNNVVYTTGLGANPVLVPLEVDARSSGQKPPIGLSPWGNTDYFNNTGFWSMNLQFINKPEYLWPNAYEWPLTEAYFQTWIYVASNEFTVESWAPNVTVWGYLAARQ